MTAEEFAVMFPNFSEEEFPQITAGIAAAIPRFDVERWGGDYARGLACYVAHHIIMNRAFADTRSDNALRSDVTMSSANGITTARDGALLAMQMKDPMLRTIYGQEYRYLARRAGRGLLVV